MKHGIAFRKLNRTTSHRMLMLRNLVTSLLEHEQIKTTLPKAKETARLAEKIITLGKKNTTKSYSLAMAFLLKPSLLPKLFTTLSTRYAERPGGYTRIHRYGNRHGDNAPMAVLELVDGERDLKFEMVSRTVGAEILSWKVRPTGVDGGVWEGGVDNVVLKDGEGAGWMRQFTRENLKKVLKYRGERGKEDLGTKAAQYINELLATPRAHEGLRRQLEAKELESEAEKDESSLPKVKSPRGHPVRLGRYNARPDRAGARPIGLGITSAPGLDRSIPTSPLGIAKGALKGLRVRKPWETKKPLTGLGAGTVDIDNDVVARQR